MTDLVHDRPAAVIREQPTPMALLQQAIERGISPDELGKLMDLQERHAANVALAAYAGALNAVMGEIPTVVRDAENSHSKARYARLETVSRAIKPVYTKHGFSISFDTETSSLADHIRMRADVLHTGGHVRSYRADVPIDGAGLKGGQNKTATQATGSTYSYARRYLTLLIFNVTVANEDDDGVGQNAPITPEQVAEIEDLIDECTAIGNPVVLPRFMSWLGVATATEIKARDFTKAIHELNRKRREKKGVGR